MTASMLLYQIYPVCHENLGEEEIRMVQSSSFPTLRKLSTVYLVIYMI